MRVPAAQFPEPSKYGVQLCVQLRTAGLRLSQLSEKWILSVRVWPACRFRWAMRHVPAEELVEGSHHGRTLALILSTKGDLIAECGQVRFEALELRSSK